MIWAHFILWASLWLASLLLVVGWEANVDRQRRGLTLPPVVVQGMTKWNQSLRGIALGDLVWICCDMYLVVVSGRHGAALSPMCATATCVSIFNYVEIIISYIYIYIYMIEIKIVKVANKRFSLNGGCAKQNLGQNTGQGQANYAQTIINIFYYS